MSTHRHQHPTPAHRVLAPMFQLSQTPTRASSVALVKREATAAEAYPMRSSARLRRALDEEEVPPGL